LETLRTLDVEVFLSENAVIRISELDLLLDKVLSGSVHFCDKIHLALAIHRKVGQQAVLQKLPR
jgi:hypothetical protein